MNDYLVNKITDTIITQLEKGIVPWRRPHVDVPAPYNLKSKKTYLGCNFFLLSCVPGCGAFMTLHQANELGFKLKKGSKGWPVIFWKLVGQEPDGQGGFKSGTGRPFERLSHVFAVEDFEDFDRSKLREYPLPDPFEALDTAEQVIEAQKPALVIEASNRNGYAPKADVVRLIPQEYFKSPEDYYGTVFHELGHWTGHHSRLNREGINGKIDRQSATYAYEELIAEMTACLLCSHCGLSPDFANDAAYIGSWLTVLRNDKTFVIKASREAQKAATFLLERVQVPAEVEDDF